MNVTTPISECGARRTNNKTFRPGSDVSGTWGMNNATPTLGSGVRGMEISTPTIGRGIRVMMHCDASTWRQHLVAEPWKLSPGSSAMDVNTTTPSSAGGVRGMNIATCHQSNVRDMNCTTCSPVSGIRGLNNATHNPGSGIRA